MARDVHYQNHCLFDDTIYVVDYILVFDYPDSRALGFDDTIDYTAKS